MADRLPDSTLEDALREYADPKNWGIERTEFEYPRCVWLGPGATEKPYPDAPALARAALARGRAEPRIDTCDECAALNVGSCPHVLARGGAEPTEDTLAVGQWRFERVRVGDDPRHEPLAVFNGEGLARPATDAEAALVAALLASRGVSAENKETNEPTKESDHEH